MKELEHSVKTELFQTPSDPPRMRKEAAPKSTHKKAEAIVKTKEETKPGATLQPGSPEVFW